MTGQELARWRVSHNYSQAEMAQELQVHPRTIVNWEQSASVPNGRMVELALKGLLFTHTAKCRCSQCGGNPNRIDDTGTRAYDPYSKAPTAEASTTP